MKSLASQETLLETRERLMHVKPDDKALWGKMTATQMVRHLACSCEVALGERAVGPMKGLPQAVLKFLALRTGVTWAKNLKSTPELIQAIAEDPGGDFNEIVRAAVAKMDAVASGVKCAPSHPMFGAMTVADWRRWGYLHTDHHLRQFGR
jgi:hypothetical protein